MSNRFFGKACRKHPELNGERYASKERRCVRCIADRNVVMYQNNKEKHDAVSAAWARANLDIEHARGKRWREANKERRIAHSKNYRAANREAINARQRARRDVERDRAKTRAYHAQNPHKSAEKMARRRARIVMATPAWANSFFISEAYHLAKLREQYCGGVWHVDHIVPIRSRMVCGLHVEHNLQILRGAENISKGNRHWPDMSSLTALSA